MSRADSACAGAGVGAGASRPGMFSRIFSGLSLLDFVDGLKGQIRMHADDTLLLMRAVSYVHRGMNRSSNIAVSNLHPESHRYADVADDFIAMYLAGYSGSSPTLAQVIVRQERFNTQFDRDGKKIFGRHGYTYNAINIPGSHERASWIAAKKLDRLREDASLVPAFHILGNNSREGMMTAIMEYQALLEQAALCSETLFKRIVDSAVFIVSSAGGKGTSCNGLDGIAIHGDVDAKVDDDGALTRQIVRVPSKGNNLQQFGNPDAVHLDISHRDGKPHVEIKTPSASPDSARSSTPFAEAGCKTPIRRVGSSVFIGESEAAVNKRYLLELLSELTPDVGARQLAYLTRRIPTIILEEDSFNTGDNCKYVADKLKADYPGLAERMLITFFQKSEQGNRATTTALLQTHVGFNQLYYNNPDYDRSLEKMDTDQQILFMMNLLTEMLVEARYLHTQKFHHALPKWISCYRLGMTLALEIYNGVNNANATLDDLTLDVAVTFFKSTLWPMIETGLIPRKGRRHDEFLQKHFSPMMTTSASNVSLVSLVRFSGSPVFGGASKPRAPVHPAIPWHDDGPLTDEPVQLSYP